VLSVLLRYTDSDYPFGIFKLFFQVLRCHIKTQQLAMSLLNSEVLIKMLEASTNNKYMMFVSFKSNTTDDTSGAHDVISGFGGIRIVQSLVLFVLLCRSCCVLWCFCSFTIVFRSMHALFVGAIRICISKKNRQHNG
jgi:hypothetical protein